MSISFGPAFRVGGSTNIAPCSPVYLDSGNDNQVVAPGDAAVGTPAAFVGFAQEGMRNAPGLAGSDVTIAAIPGDQVRVTTPGNVALAVADSAITRGARVKVSSTVGQITSITNNGGSPVQQDIFGYALESAGGQGVKITVWVWPHQYSF